jgi:hypothetical protein
MVKCPGHDFIKISILHHRELLDGLKKLVMINPMAEVTTVARGMLPRVRTSQQLAKILEMVSKLVQQFREHGDILIKAVEKAVGHKSLGIGSCHGEPIERDVG